MKTLTGHSMRFLMMCECPEECPELKTCPYKDDFPDTFCDYIATQIMVERMEESRELMMEV